MDDSSLREIILSMTTRRSEIKIERYRATKVLASTLFSLVSGRLQNGWDRKTYIELIGQTKDEWLRCKEHLFLPPPKHPQQPLFQEFSAFLCASGNGVLSDPVAFELGAWLEEKFSSGNHPFWSAFLDRVFLTPYGINSRPVFSALLAMEGIIHCFDDYTDRKHDIPSHSMLNVGLAIALIVSLPVLFEKADTTQRSDDDKIITPWKVFWSAFEDILQVPQMEDETPQDIRGARGNIEREIEMAARNIDFRTRATTRIFFDPLTSMMPGMEKDIRLVWDAFWLSRATEMCAKDAVFDVEADILNQDFTPASVWGEDFGVGSDDWCVRVSSLYRRYLSLWSSYFMANSSLMPAIIGVEIETRIQRNRFVIESLISEKSMQLPLELKKIKKIFMVASGKGGVGKSTVAWLIANDLKERGMKVGVVDADIWGPSQSILFRGDARLRPNNSGILSEETGGTRLLTLGRFVAQNDPILIRSAVAAKLLKQLIFAAPWPNLDYLIVDLPPGASDIHMQLCSVFPDAEMIIVTLPQPMAIADTNRTVAIYFGLNKKIKGLVMNMTGLLCDSCGKENKLGKAVYDAEWKGLAISGVKLLGELPFYINIAELYVDGHSPQSVVESDLRGRLKESVSGIVSEIINS